MNKYRTILTDQCRKDEANFHLALPLCVAIYKKYGIKYHADLPHTRQFTDELLDLMKKNKIGRTPQECTDGVNAFWHWYTDIAVASAWHGGDR